MKLPDERLCNSIGRQSTSAHNGAWQHNAGYVNTLTGYIWTSTRENLSSVGCEQQRHRHACADAQSDQHLCYSRFGKYNISAYYKRNFIFLSSLCSWAGWFDSHFVRNPEDRFCPDEAHIRNECMIPDNLTHSLSISGMTAWYGVR